MKKRRAATLFELMLVLAILVIVAGLAIPSLGSMSGHYKLTGAVDVVRSSWAEARARAIDEGRPYRFSIQPDGRAFRIAPDQDDYWSGQGGPSEDPNGKGLIRERSLPRGVRFAVGEGNAAPASSEPDRFDFDDEPVKGGNWTTTVVFLPDGTAREDVRIRFEVNGSKPIILQLRGLTGEVSATSEDSH